MKRCMYCGHENEDSSQNCSKCGNRLLDFSPEQAMPAVDFPEELPEEEKQETEAAATRIMPDRNDLFREDGSDAEADGPSGQEEISEEEASGEDGETFEQEPAQEDLTAEAEETDARPEEEFPEEPVYEEAPEEYPQADPFYGGQDPYRARNIDPSFEPYGQTNGYPYGAAGYGAGAPGPEVQQQYAGQAYGYSQEVQQYGYPDRRQQEQEAYDYGRAQGHGTAGGSRQFMIKARKAVRSPLFFLALLFYTVMTVASVANLVSGNMINTLNSFQDTAQMVLGSNVAITFMNSLIDIIEGMDAPILLAVNLVFCIPGLLMGIGMWMAFFQTSPSRAQISTSGFTLTKVMVILKFIGLCLLLTAGLIISVAFVVAAGAASSVASIIVGVVLLVIMILVSALVILFYVQLLHCIKVMKWNTKSGVNMGRISLYVPVMGLLLAAGTVLTMLPMAPNDYLGLASRGTSAAWILFASFWVFYYRAKTKR